MQLHYTSIPSWSFSQNETSLQQILSKIVHETIQQLPLGFYQHPHFHIDWIKKQKLYQILQKIPKGVLHHDHFDCNQDAQFYHNCVIDDPIVYAHKDKKQFYVGTQKQALQKGFISMKNFEQLLGSRQKLVETVSSFTMMTKQDYLEADSDMKVAWKIFQDKILNFDFILGSLHLFKKYVDHVLRKYIKNGYQRIQFRALLIPLTQYDQKGEIIKIHPKSQFAKAFDQVYHNIVKQYPTFTVGFIFFCLLSFTDDKNRQTLKDICELGWQKTIAIDFVNEQDPYGSLQPYDKLANQILSNYPHLNLKKIYHCGQTKNHKNRNIQIALNAGSARIGHGNNVVQWLQTLKKCIQKSICFEKCLMSNLIFKYSYDTRFDASVFIFAVGIPITINPDDPGKFGYEDTTCDYFLAAVSYNWSLRNFKIIGYHSINHAVGISHENKKQMCEEYDKKWTECAKQLTMQGK